MPSSSPSWARRRLFSQLATQGSGIVAYVLPLEQLAPNRPSLSAFPPTSAALRGGIGAAPLRRIAGSAFRVLLRGRQSEYHRENGVQHRPPKSLEACQRRLAGKLANGR